MERPVQIVYVSWVDPSQLTGSFFQTFEVDDLLYANQLDIFIIYLLPSKATRNLNRNQ